MLTLRTRIFVMVSVIVLIILGISVGLLLLKHYRNKPIVTTPTVTTTQTGIPVGSLPLVTQPIDTPIQSSVPTGLQVQQRTTAEATQGGVKLLAKIFIERYATYSTDSNYQNIRDIESQVTPTLWKTLSARLSTPQAKGSFTGVTTDVITTAITDWQEASATIELKTQALTTKDSAQLVTSYPTYTVRMVKVDKNWLVDSVTSK